MTYLFCNWKFVPLNLPHLFLSSPTPLPRKRISKIIVKYDHNIENFMFHSTKITFSSFVHFLSGFYSGGLVFWSYIVSERASLVSQTVKNLHAMCETWVGKIMATHSSILSWRIPKDRGAWQASPWGHRVRHNWATKRSTQSLKCIDSFVSSFFFL